MRKKYGSLAVLLAISSSVLVGIILGFLGLFICWAAKKYKIYEKIYS
jgi:hypothetical protein